MCIERNRLNGAQYKLLCTKESHAEQMERAGQAIMVLPQVQAIFAQVLDPAEPFCCTCILQCEVLLLGIHTDLLVATF